MLNRLKEDIASIFARDPAAQSVFEIITTYPGIHAVLIHRLSH
ncbi:MAG: serine O-acetyltransferase, partial [Methylococcaceae bacterium]|nr:serine O-acetyltransferase [Methylococcaceae bacterium]